MDRTTPKTQDLYSTSAFISFGSWVMSCPSTSFLLGHHSLLSYPLNSLPIVSEGVYDRGTCLLYPWEMLAIDFSLLLPRQHFFSPYIRPYTHSLIVSLPLGWTRSSIRELFFKNNCQPWATETIKKCVNGRCDERYDWPLDPVSNRWYTSTVSHRALWTKERPCNLLLALHSLLRIYKWARSRWVCPFVHIAPLITILFIRLGHLYGWCVPLSIYV